MPVFIVLGKLTDKILANMKGAKERDDEENKS